MLLFSRNFLILEVMPSGSFDCLAKVESVLSFAARSALLASF